MATWLPILKTALPIIADVLKVAIPAFTSGADAKKKNELIPEQISELQSAVTQNSKLVKTVAMQLKETIEGVDIASIKIQNEILFLKRLSMLSITVAVISFIFVLWSILKG